MPREFYYQLRRDTAANWTSTNPILGSGEPGYETDTGKLKIGDNSTVWNSLAYVAGLSGFSGYSGGGGSGSSGFSGYSGAGSSGFSGYSGKSGSSGFSGYSGTTGPTGTSGFSGYSGQSGISGFSGYSGKSGFSGYSGSGTSGFSGYSGQSGISGFSGYSGSSGFSGYSGANLLPSNNTWTGQNTFQNQTFGTGVIIQDTFDRTNSSSSIGTPSDGGSAWVVQTSGGTWGITSNTAYSVSSTAQSIVVRDAGVTECTVAATITSATDCGIIGRCSDDNNYWLASMSSGAYHLYKRVAGAYTLVGSGGTYTSGDVLSMTFSGNTVIVNVNRQQWISTSDSFNNTATKYGLRANTDTGVRFDNFVVSKDILALKMSAGQMGSWVNFQLPDGSSGGSFATNTVGNATMYLGALTPAQTVGAFDSLLIGTGSGTNGLRLWSTNGECQVLLWNQYSFSTSLILATQDYWVVAAGRLGTRIYSYPNTAITMGSSYAPTVQPITDASTVNVNASLGNEVTITLNVAGASRTFAAPTQATDGQILAYRIKQDGTGSRTVTWDAIFRFPGGTAPTLTTTASKTDYVVFRYNGTDTKWDYQYSTLNL